MVISASLYQQILYAFPFVPPEAGGIIGMSNGIISHFQFDKGTAIYGRAEYIPNIDFLNHVISQWAQQGIRFAGILHSHPVGQEQLSGADMEYIHKIMKSMHCEYDLLFFPVIIPHLKIVPFRAEYKLDGTHIERDSFLVI